MSFRKHHVNRTRRSKIQQFGIFIMLPNRPHNDIYKVSPKFSDEGGFPNTTIQWEIHL